MVRCMGLRGGMEGVKTHYTIRTTCKQKTDSGVTEA